MALPSFVGATRKRTRLPASAARSGHVQDNRGWTTKGADHPATDDRPRDLSAAGAAGRLAAAAVAAVVVLPHVLTSFCSGRAGLAGLAEWQNPEQSAPAGGDQGLQASGACRPLDIGLMC